MRCVVQKYGGSSVADLDKIRAVAARIAATRADGVGVVAVVSAMGNTTNELLALAREVAPEPAPRELDMLVSIGERVTMALLAMALIDRGVDAVSLTGSQSGIVTDERHADATVVQVRPQRLQEVLAAGKVAIVAGFQGVSRTREVTTLGRGGSDTTAVVLAAALNAAHCEICSDVDGVWSADPRVVPEAVRLDALGLDAALALARGGAKVLFEDALAHARSKGVEIVASSTFGAGAGTRLTVAPPPRRAVAVTGDRLVDVPRALGLPEALEAVGARVRRSGADWVHADTRHAVRAIPEAWSPRPVAVVTAAGAELARCLGWADAVGAALADAGIGVVRQGAEGDGAWWEVAEVERIDDAVRVVHALRGHPALD